MEKLILIILREKLQEIMRQNLVWLKERKQSRSQERERKKELSTVMNEAEEAQGRRLGFILEKPLHWRSG